MSREQTPGMNIPKLEGFRPSVDIVMMPAAYCDRSLQSLYFNRGAQNVTWIDGPLNHYPVRLVTFSIEDQQVALYSGESHGVTQLGKARREELKQIQMGLQTIINQATAEGKKDLLDVLNSFPDTDPSTYIYQPSSAGFLRNKYYKFTYVNGKPTHIIDLLGAKPRSIADLAELIKKRQAAGPKAANDIEDSLKPKTSEKPTPPATPSARRSSGGGFFETLLSAINDSREAGRDTSILASFKEDTSGVSLGDYIGEDTLIKQMQHIIGSLKDPRLYREAGFPVERKLLLAGPPGTGKTLFTKTLAHEIGADFYKPTFSKTGSPFQAESGNRMNKILDAAEAKAKEGPVVLLIDELDGMGSNASVGHMSDASQGMRDALLTRIQEIQNPNLIIIGTTNKPDQIDPALQRHGRFGKPIMVLPFTTASVKEKALRVFMGKASKEFDKVSSDFFSSDIDFASIIAKLPNEVTGAECDKLIRVAMSRRGERVLSHKQHTVDLISTEDIIASLPAVFDPENRIGFI